MVWFLYLLSFWNPCDAVASGLTYLLVHLYVCISPPYQTNQLESVLGPTKNYRDLRGGTHTKPREKRVFRK